MTRQNHPHRHHHGHPHGDMRAARNNWRSSSLPFIQKLKIAGGNTWIKIRNRQPCCDHPGEPGC